MFAASTLDIWIGQVLHGKGEAPSGITGPMQMRSMLIVFAGLPGTGKSSVARELAGKLDAVWLRIDSIEQAIRESGFCQDQLTTSDIAQRSP